MVETRRGGGLERSVSLDADVTVIGSGAGGSMAARELARRGLRVVVLEEGPALNPTDMSQREVDMLAKLYQERGARSTADLGIRVMGGRNVGGSTVHNLNLCQRAPRAILERWRDDYRVSGCGPAEMNALSDVVEKDLSVSDVPVAWRNTNNQVLARGVAALGWRGGPLRHNRVGCQQSGFCELGCPFNAKQNAAKVLLPQAQAAGAEIWSELHAERVVHDGRQVKGVVGHGRAPDGSRRAQLWVRSPAVVLAGSAIGSATCALRSGLPDPYSLLGRGLQLHPGVAVVGDFEAPLRSWKGIPQSFECTEWLDFDARSQRRVWITTAMAHPVGASTLLPGFGKGHREWMLRYPHLAALTAMVHDETRGRVRLQAEGRALIDYQLEHSDVRQLALGMRSCARLLFAAGARRVLIPAIPPRVLRRPGEVHSLDDSIAEPHSTPITAVHPMGTLPMSDDPRLGCVDSTGEHHQVAGLFVADGSLFPTGIGVPPQITIYALGLRVGRRVAERFGGK